MRRASTVKVRAIRFTSPIRTEIGWSFPKTEVTYTATEVLHIKRSAVRRLSVDGLHFLAEDERPLLALEAILLRVGLCLNEKSLSLTLYWPRVQHQPVGRKNSRAFS